MNSTKLTYKDAGVDIDAGNALVKRIKSISEKTRRPEVMGGIGGFSALFELPLHRYQQPVLVSSTDGVGTKLKLALETGCHDFIGIDLVAMCVNDLLVCGAEPLFFLDYYATGKLNVDIAEVVIRGIGEGCQQAGASLVGGETAEMPGVYHADDYDLAGFCVGIVEKQKIIDGSQVRVGDCLLGIASSGPHSNGYSLIRKILDVKKMQLTKDLQQQLLAPTRIYVKPILELLNHVAIHAMAHITGGGIVENLARVIPKGLQANIQRHAWSQPPIFTWLQQQGNIADTELLRTFNCGIGMILCVAADDVTRVTTLLEQHGEKVFAIGEIVAGKPGQATVEVF